MKTVTLKRSNDNYGDWCSVSARAGEGLCDYSLRKLWPAVEGAYRVHLCVGPFWDKNDASIIVIKTSVGFCGYYVNYTGQLGRVDQEQLEMLGVSEPDTVQYQYTPVCLALASWLLGLGRIEGRCRIRLWTLP